MYDDHEQRVIPKELDLVFASAGAEGNSRHPRWHHGDKSEQLKTCALLARVPSKTKLAIRQLLVRCQHQLLLYSLHVTIARSTSRV